MIRTDHDIQHSLAHMEIGEPAVHATITDNQFPAANLINFFRELREGHRSALSQHSNTLVDVIGNAEHNELDEFGAFGQFAGRLAVRESGLATIESVLHHGSTPVLQDALRASLTSAVQSLRS